MNVALRLVALVLMLAVTASAAEVSPPLPATIPLIEGQPVKGQITKFDGETVTVLAGETATDIPWTDVKPQAIFALHERLLAKGGGGEQWMAVGVTLMKVAGGTALAERAFARAARLDPTLKGEIDAARSGVATSRPTFTDGDADDAAADGAAAPAGVTWGRQDDAERAQTVKTLKKRAGEMLARAGTTKLTLAETNYFLFYTDMTPTEAQRWTQVLDRMYARLAEMFGVPKDENLWHGKAVIFVFVKREDFQAFEEAAFNIAKDAAPAAAGRCHQRGDGSVYVTFYRSASPDAFARLLVHESTHGFLFRYRARTRIPSWANEGLAQVIEYELVPAAGLLQAEHAQARVELRKPNALKDFFASEQIEPAQYPIAQTLTEFMIRQNKRGYVAFINGIKDGLRWDEALKEKYGLGADELIAAYGQSMGVAGLRLE
jgi:hypothetical protein